MTDAEKQIREALADPALFDPGASTADTYSACKAFGTACTPENMRELLAAHDALKADAERYRRWLRGGKEIPAHSVRWARWEVRQWDGRYWNTLFAEQMDAAIDAARGQA